MKITTSTISYLMVAGAVTLLLLLSFFVRVGATANSVAVLKTSGMTCSSCSHAITAALQTVNGVAVTEVDVEGGWVVVGYDSKTVQPGQLAEKVSGTGYTSAVHRVLTPGEYKQITGKEIGRTAASTPGCCGNGGCRAAKQGQQS